VIPLDPYEKLAWMGIGQILMFIAQLLSLALGHWLYCLIRRACQPSHQLELPRVASDVASSFRFPFNQYFRAFTAILIFRYDFHCLCVSVVHIYIDFGWDINSYTTVTSSVFTFLKCTSVGPYSVVYAAPAINCNSQRVCHALHSSLIPPPPGLNI
jgi:hypothetical protein